ncbi:MAG: 3-deoxy-manno-octulosonate cytidylyltransferase [Gammaproteobacteria bacterium]|nr:3-deoxy-manno-octulosonate cytidylyltransferase [Gammaproteobacteria bacterium]
MSFRVVIPARYGSTRLPGKPLREIAGRTMIERVYRQALESDASEVIVATEDQRISSVCEGFGATVCMTRPDHQSGTDRIAEVARCMGWSDEVMVVNVQGDEPGLPAQLVNQVASLLANRADAQIATLATPVSSMHEFMDVNAVKVVADSTGRAMYFSRAPIPWARDSAPSGLLSQTSFDGAWRHLGLYAYRVGALLQLADAQPSPLELAEKLEQLRAMEMGMTIMVALASCQPGQGVDTQADLDRVAAQWANS